MSHETGGRRSVVYTFHNLISTSQTAVFVSSKHPIFHFRHHHHPRRRGVLRRSHGARCGSWGGGREKAVFPQLRLMSCNLEQQEAVAAQYPRWQMEEEASNQRRSFPDNKGSRGRRCSKRPLQCSCDAFPPRKFKHSQQVGGLYKKNGKWMVDLLAFPVIPSTQRPVRYNNFCILRQRYAATCASTRGWCTQSPAM